MDTTAVTESHVELKPSRLPGGIVKRDGSRASFETQRIAVAIQRAGQASGEFDEEEAFASYFLSIIENGCRNAFQW